MGQEAPGGRSSIDEVEAGDVVRYGLYALTVALGIALVIWILRARQASEEQERYLRRAKAEANAEESPARIKAVRGMPPTTSMAQALAGIRLPVHWQPDPPVEVQSPFTLTTNQESAADMAETLTRQLVRIGYRITPSGATSARAVRENNSLAIEVDVDDAGSFVSSRITLTETVRG